MTRAGATCSSCALFAFLAGGLDAVVGGGGLVQLPALLVVLPQVPVVQLLGTNKLASVVGTGVGGGHLQPPGPVDRRDGRRMAGAAFVGAGAGALLATRVGSDVLKPVVLVALVACSSTRCAPRRSARSSSCGCGAGAQRAVALGGGAGIGFYDGFIGPGTGSFLVFLLVGGVGLSFLHASATAKVVNTTTNLSALRCSPPAVTSCGRWARRWRPPTWPAARWVRASRSGAAAAGSARSSSSSSSALVLRLAYDVLL